MIILDTDHVNVLQRPEHAHYVILSANMKESGDPNFVTTVISVEEQMRGWLAAIHRARKAHNQILYYTRLVGMIHFFGELRILPFNEPAADRFETLRKERVRIGTMDLKIASIALEERALLLSANLRDFERVPDLRVENWLR
ncbi:MAG: type II toxin-antitoxin system VapC family toxin [Planctomycetes bacterium]|nr:type II toxin-antitoxin system VapC family toxin [Planctomycetota bacterium]